MGYLANKRIKSGGSNVAASANSVAVSVDGRVQSITRKSSDGSAFNSTYLPEFNTNEGDLYGNKGCHIIASGDSAQPSNIIGNANLRLIEGGYDNTIYACLASCILGSNHSVISGTSSHAFISSGSTITAHNLSYGGVQSGLYVTVSGRDTYAAGCEGESELNPMIVDGDRTVALSCRLTDVTGDESFAAASDFSTLDANNSVLLSSYNCLVTGNFSEISNSRDCQATELRSSAKGYGAVAHAISMQARADGYFSVPGDRQIAKVGPLTGVTSGASYEELRLNNSETDPTDSAGRFPIKLNTIVEMRMRFFGTSLDGEYICRQIRTSVYKNIGGTISECQRELNSGTYAALQDSTQGTPNDNMTAGTELSGGVVKIRARGEAGVTMYWQCDLEVIEFGGAF